MLTAAAAICGDAHVLSGAAAAREYGASRRGPPLLVAKPASVAAVQRLVQHAADQPVPVVAWGSGSRQDWGPPPPVAQPPCVIDLRRLTQPQAIQADNLTVTVGAGLSLADLDALLAAEGLCWPVERLERVTTLGLHNPMEIGGADLARHTPTVGGTVATAAAGPSRRAIGPTARWVLGAEVVTAQGELVHAGGRTVKNVAGYDLTRMLVGSWGALGLLTAVTLRLAARPAMTRSLLLTFAGPSAVAGAAAALADHPLAAAAVELLDAATLAQSAPALPHPTPAESGGAAPEWALWVRAEGNEERVAGLERATYEIARRHGGTSHVLDDDAAALVWRARRAAWRPRGAGVVRGTWTIPRGGLAAALTMLPQLLPASDLVECRISGHAGDGLLHIVLQPRDEHARPAFVPAAVRCITALRAAAAALGGSWRTELAPAEVWSRAGADTLAARQRLFDRFRAAADPEGRFSLMAP